MPYTLNEIIREKIIEDGRTTLHKFEQLLPLGIRGVRDLNISVGGNLKTVHLTPNSYNAIAAPSDYFSWSKVGVCIGGEIYNLSMNNDLCFPHMTNACGQLQPENYNPYEGEWSGYTAGLLGGTGLGWVYWNYTSFNEFGEFTGRLYGLGQGYNKIGYFRFNPQTNEFVLTPGLQFQSIVLEYVPTGINNAMIIVPDEAIEAVISFICWKASKGNERMMYKAEYNENVMKLRLAKFSFTLDDMISTIRNSYMLSPKG